MNRGTFYAHYRDIYDLLEQTENELFQELEAVLDAYSSEHIRQDTCPFCRMCSALSAATSPCAGSFWTGRRPTGFSSD